MEIFKESADIKPLEKMEDKTKLEKLMSMDKIEAIMDKMIEVIFDIKTDEGIKLDKSTENREILSVNPYNSNIIELVSKLSVKDLTNKEKGNLCEMIMDQVMEEYGYHRISLDQITDVNDKGHTGIDGVYYNPNGVPKYIIADAKYGQSPLSNTLDGKQMSEKWIDARLDESVGKAEADKIREEKLINPENVGSFVVKIDSDLTIRYIKLDNEANTVEKDVKFDDKE